MAVEEKLEKVTERLNKLEKENQRLKKRNKQLERKITSSNHKEESKSEETSRREFLKKLGAGVVGIGAASLVPSASALDIKDSRGLQVFDDTGTEYLDVNSGGPVEVKNAALDTTGNNIESSGTVIWNGSSGYIEQTALENNSVTVAGNNVSLGGSTNISHSDLSDAPSSAHHTKYSDSDAVSAINGDSDHGSTAAHNYFSGNYGDLSNVPTTFTPENHGNSSHSTNYLASSDYNPEADTHSRYQDSEARTAVNGANINISGDADSVDGYDIEKNGSDTNGVINFKT